MYLLQNLFAIIRTSFQISVYFLSSQWICRWFWCVTMLLMRASYDHFDITEEMASVHRSPVRGITTVKDIFQEVEWTVCYILIFSGSYESALCCTNTGLIGRTCNAKTASCPKPIFLHCNIRQQAFCGKSLDISCAVDFVVSAGDCVRSHGLRHHQFHT